MFPAARPRAENGQSASLLNRLPVSAFTVATLMRRRNWSRSRTVTRRGSDGSGGVAACGAGDVCRRRVGGRRGPAHDGQGRGRDKNREALASALAVDELQPGRCAPSWETAWWRIGSPFYRPGGDPAIIRLWDTASGEPVPLLDYEAVQPIDSYAGFGAGDSPVQVRIARPPPTARASSSAVGNVDRGPVGRPAGGLIAATRCPSSGWLETEPDPVHASTSPR